MSGFTIIEKGTVKIVHHSTSSLIEVIIKDREEVEQGQSKELDKIVYLDYTQFDDLAEAIKTIKDI